MVDRAPAGRYLLRKRRRIDYSETSIQKNWVFECNDEEEPSPKKRRYPKTPVPRRFGTFPLPSRSPKIQSPKARDTPQPSRAISRTRNRMPKAKISSEPPVVIPSPPARRQRQKARPSRAPRPPVHPLVIVFPNSSAAAQPVATQSVKVQHSQIAPIKLSMVINPVPPVVIEPVAHEWLDLGRGIKGDNVPVQPDQISTSDSVGREKGGDANKDTQEKEEQEDGESQEGGGQEDDERGDEDKDSGLGSKMDLDSDHPDEMEIVQQTPEMQQETFDVMQESPDRTPLFYSYRHRQAENGSTPADSENSKSNSAFSGSSAGQSRQA